jgi:hypothetical protein
MHQDWSQAVFVTLLQSLGRSRFDSLAKDIGRFGIRHVLIRETPERPHFFRAIDMVKQRAIRERVHQSLGTVHVPGSSSNSDTKAWRDAIHEASTTPSATAKPPRSIMP